MDRLGWLSEYSEPALRSALRVAGAGLDRDGVIATAFGAYQLRLPSDAWVDLEVAAGSLHQAEGKIAAGRALDAYGEALVALGATVFVGSCTTCHMSDGGGSADGYAPSVPPLNE